MVASLCDLLIMKAHAIQLRDKPKDVYDLCYCLEHYPGGFAALSANWLSRPATTLSIQALDVLAEKFKSVDQYGSRQLAVFLDSRDAEETQFHSRRAFELVQKFLSILQTAPKLDTPPPFPP